MPPATLLDQESTAMIIARSQAIDHRASPGPTSDKQVILSTQGQQWPSPPLITLFHALQRFGSQWLQRGSGVSSRGTHYIVALNVAPVSPNITLQRDFTCLLGGQCAVSAGSGRFPWPPRSQCMSQWHRYCQTWTSPSAHSDHLGGQQHFTTA